jgi:hypothetical protein
MLPTRGGAAGSAPSPPATTNATTCSMPPVDVASIRIWLRDPRPMIHGTRPSTTQSAAEAWSCSAARWAG